MPLFLVLTLIAYIISAFLTISLAFTALSFNFRQSLSQTFAWFTLSLAAWAVSANLLRITLWFEVGRDVFLYLPAIPFYLTGPALVTFTVRYLGLPTRLADRLSVVAVILLIFTLPPLFQGELYSDPTFNRATGIMSFEISPLGLWVGAAPIAFTGVACWLFWRQRRQWSSPFLAISVFVLFAGMLLEIVLRQSIPMTPLATGLSALVLGYGVSRQQLFNPLRERTQELQREIQERERMSKALSASEEQYRFIFEASPLGIHQYELQQPGDRLVFTGANPAADWIMGVKNQQFVGKTIEEAFPPLMNTELPENYRRVCKEGESWFTEQIDYADEKIRGAFEVHVFSSTPGKVTVMFNDVTVRKQAELALTHSQEAEKRFAERLASLLNVVNHLSTAENITQLSRQAVVLGRTLLYVDRVEVWLTAPDQQGLLGTFSINQHGHLQDEHRTEIPVKDAPALRQLIEIAAPQSITTSGPLRPIQGMSVADGLYAIASMWDGQAVVGLIQVDNLFSQRAVSPRDCDLLELYATSLGHMYSLKKAQEDIRKLSEELEARVEQRTSELRTKNSELETFTYSVSHDLKAPLRGIEGYSHLLQEDYAAVLGEEGLVYTQNIRQGIQRMTQLIDDLLTYSRLEQLEIFKGITHLPALVDAVLARYREEIEQRQVQVIVNLTNGEVTGEIEILSMSVRNLIDNALKFTRQTQPARIEIGSRTQGSTCLFWVQDNGIGFDMKYHERIFQIFQRLHLPEDYPGTGIGLALVRVGIERTGGRVWAESAPGKGSIFYLEIPQ